MKKKCLLLALLFLSAIHFQIQITLGVPGDSFSDPITAYTGTNYGSITGSESEYFWLATSGEYEFSLTGPSGTDFDMKVYDGNQNQIGSATSTSYPDVVNASSNNGFYVRVYPYSGSGSFALNIVGSSFGESFDNPIIANLGNNYGEITTVQTSVYYWFSSTGEYDFTLTGPSGTDLDMRVYDGNQNQIGSATSTSYPDYLTVSSTNGFYIRIYQYSGTGSFTLNIEVATLPGESFAHPLTAHLGNNQGELSNQFPDVYYWFDESGIFTFQLDADPSTDFDMVIYNGNQFELGSATSTSYPDVVTAESTNGFYIQVYQYSGTGSFTLTIIQGSNPGIEAILYYEHFRNGDIIQWTAYSMVNSTDRIDATIQVDILRDSPVYTYNQNTDLFRIHDFSEPYTDIEASPYILPIRFDNLDGSSLNFEQILTTFSGGMNPDCNAQTCIVQYSEIVGRDSTNLIMEYDKQTGILLNYELNMILEETRYELSLSLNGDISEIKNRDMVQETDDNLFNIPFNPIFGMFFLIVIPLIQKRKNDNQN